MKTRIFCIACLFATIAACNGGEHTEQTEQTSESPSKNTAITPPSAAHVSANAFKIKGLYLGMDIHEVPNALIDILSRQQLSGFGFTEVIQYSNGDHCVLLYDKQFLKVIAARMQERYDTAKAQQKIDDELQSSCYVSDGVLAVKAGADGRVSRIEFNAVGDLFDAKKQTAAEFAHYLVNEYKIPSMKPNAERSGWSYVSADGTKVEVIIKKIFGVEVTRLYLSRA